MNIFILSEDPTKAAQLQCDKHVVKMIVESAQMLSTAHRMLDGYVEKRPSKSGKRMINYWVHPKPYKEELLYKAVTPFLDNLCKNPEKSTIFWPDRVGKIEAYQSKLLTIVEGN